MHNFGLGSFRPLDTLLADFSVLSAACKNPKHEDTYAKNPHWNVFVSYGRDYTLSFLAERLESQAATGHFFCGSPKMNEGEIALVCLERIPGKSILKYSGNSPALKKIIVNSNGLAAPYFYVVSEILKNPEALDAVRDYLLESEKSEAKK